MSRRVDLHGIVHTKHTKDHRNFVPHFEFLTAKTSSSNLPTQDNLSPSNRTSFGYRDTRAHCTVLSVDDEQKNMPIHRHSPS